MGYKRRKRDSQILTLTRELARVGSLKNKFHIQQNQEFLEMTGISLEEKNFRNMVDYYKPLLIEIIEARDESDAIMVLPRNDRKTMVKNGLITGEKWQKKTWSISIRAKKYLVDL
jgi:hypothetical protein